MKFCFVGIGSIAIKHIKNLLELDDKVIIHALRSNRSNFSEQIPLLVHKQFYNVEELDTDYDAVFICNPTSLHIETLKLVKDRARNFFIEKPISDDVLDKDTMHALKDLRIYVACPLRYNSVIRYIKNIVNHKGTPINARIMCSSYLPQWRNEDYRKTYSAKKELGGGVDIDLIHEVDYMVHLFGMPSSKVSQKGTFSNLEIDSFDLTAHIFSYSNFLVEMHLDYFGFKKQRYIELFYNDCYVLGDLQNDCVEIVGEKVETIHLEPSNFFKNEMQNFIDFCSNKHAVSNDLECANQVLQISKN